MIRDAADDAEIMGDEEHSHAEPALQLLEKLEDLRLHGDVERGGRLVGDQQLGLVGERHGDHHPLALAARELMGEGVEPFGGVADADEVEEFERALAGRLAGEALVQLQDLADLPRHGVQRVERGHRLLEDHGDVVAAHLAQLVLRRGEKVAPLEEHAAGRVRGWRVLQELEDRERETDFPEPDSPTSASVWPGASVKETRSTASVVRPPWAKATERSSTERRGAVISPHLSGKAATQSLATKIAGRGPVIDQRLRDR